MQTLHTLIEMDPRGTTRERLKDLQTKVIGSGRKAVRKMKVKTTRKEEDNQPRGTMVRNIKQEGVTANQQV